VKWRKVSDYCIERGNVRVCKVWHEGWKYERWEHDGSAWRQGRLYATPEEARLGVLLGPQDLAQGSGQAAPVSQAAAAGEAVAVLPAGQAGGQTERAALAGQLQPLGA